MEPMWLKEVLLAGQTANGFKLGTVLTLGWFWSRVNGCRIVYRGMSMEAVDFDDVLAVAESDANEITMPSWLSHEPGQTYFYAVRCANRYGQIERTLAAAVKVTITEEDEIRTGRPNSVFGMAAVVRRDGKAEVVWTYSPLEQESNPVEMRIYGDEGTGEVDYQEAISIVPYKGRKFYRYESEQLGNGRYLFAVRTADAESNERESRIEAGVEVRTGNPEAIEIISIERV